MKRLILAALVCGAAFAFPAAAMADPPICHDGILSDDAGQGCADGLYAQVYGHSASGGNWFICHDGILSDDVGMGCTSNYRSAGTAVMSPSTGYVSGGLSDVPGVPSSFAACVALRESTNGQLSSNVYGIVGPGGQGSLAAQKQAFSQMYAARGSQPWAPYDGC